MSSTSQEFAAGEFAKLWAENLSLVLAKVGGTPSPIQITSVEPEPAPTDGDTYFCIVAAGAVRGEMSLRVPPSDALQLVNLFVGGPARSQLTGEDRQTLEELFRQVAGHVSTAAAEKWEEVPITVSLAGPPTWPPGATGWFSSPSSAANKISVQYLLSPALTTSLQNGIQDQQNEAGKLSSVAEPGRLGLLMNVELDLSLRFGGRSLLLKEILDLGAGSVVELDRDIQDPADLLLDGKLIARGDLVVVDGNFGLRVTEIFAVPATGT